MLAALTLRGFGATKIDVDFYVKWSTLSTEEILAKGEAYFENKSDVDSATVCFAMAATRLKNDLKSRDKAEQYALALTRLGQLYLSTYFDYSKAYSNLQEAYDLTHKYNIQALMPSICNNLASLYMQRFIQTRDQHSLADGIALMRESFDTAVATDNYDMASISLTNLITNVLFYGKLSEIEAEIKTFKSLPAQDSLPYKTAMRMCDAAEWYAAGELERALDYFTEHYREIDPSPQNRRERLMLNNQRIRLLDDLGRRSECLSLLHENETIAIAGDYRDILIHTYRDLAQLHDEAGNTDLAHQFLLKYYQQRDSLVINRELGNIYEMKFRYDLGKASDQVAELNRKQREQQVMGIMALCVIGFVGAMMWIKIRDNRKLRANNHFLYQKNLEMLAQEAAQRQLIEQYQAQPAMADAEADREKYKGSNLTIEEKDDIAMRIKQALETSPEVFEFDYSLQTLSDKVRVPYRSVSQVINETYGKSFSNVLTEVRVKEACRRLQAEGHEKYTIEALAESVGFKSRTNFASNFKSITGLTPSQYIKMMQK